MRAGSTVTKRCGSQSGVPRDLHEQEAALAAIRAMWREVRADRLEAVVLGDLFAASEIADAAQRDATKAVAFKALGTLLRYRSRIEREHRQAMAALETLRQRRLARPPAPRPSEPKAAAPAAIPAAPTAAMPALPSKPEPAIRPAAEGGQGHGDRRAGRTRAAAPQPAPAPRRWPVISSTGAGRANQ